MIVRITPVADRDLEVIGDFRAADNPARAISFLAELRKTCASLADYPNRYPIVPRLEQYGIEQYGIRKCSHGRYPICYRAWLTRLRSSVSSIARWIPMSFKARPSPAQAAS
ncbi:type II toxin-antitoxin system RelE/ParE family toxin [Blastomonas aquatica]|uniref:type II toxin-antitoxin system RelE/ParE family toxin n=1 Tax=Blastomonas aquatica TaxID=1510276 RepID=UPI001E364F06|nr:type II toxin-antitoxin system RelE/ParE family toxin [Blastomonas aquatica]